MTRVRVVLEFDENDLGKGWLNADNLDLLLYTETATKKDLLRVISYTEIPVPKSSPIVAD